MASGRPSASPTVRTSSLKSMRSGSISWNVMSVGSPLHVVMRLNRAGVARIVVACGFDHVGVERALGQEGGRVHAPLRGQACGFGLEDADEAGADDLALLLRVGDAG